MQIGINHHQKCEVKCVVYKSTQSSTLRKPEMRLRPTVGDEKPYAVFSFKHSTNAISRVPVSAVRILRTHVRNECVNKQGGRRKRR